MEEGFAEIIPLIRPFCRLVAARQRELGEQLDALRITLGTLKKNSRSWREIRARHKEVCAQYEDVCQARHFNWAKVSPAFLEWLAVVQVVQLPPDTYATIKQKYEEQHATHR
jgi:hypothetical protein